MCMYVSGEEDTDTSFSSVSEDLENQMKTHHSGAAASDYRHSSTHCLACCRLRDRKISASSYLRHRTGNNTFSLDVSCSECCRSVMNVLTCSQVIKIYCLLYDVHYHRINMYLQTY